MELKFSIATVLLLCALCYKQADSREITHEDIKEAMLSLVHMMRDNTEKLERHEARDRQTAEQLKKAISLLTKRMSTVDGLKAHLVKLDERVAGIEQLIVQRDERERIQIQKTSDTLEDLESRLEGWATEIETKVVEASNRATAAAAAAAATVPTAPTEQQPPHPHLLSRLDAGELKIAEKLDKLEAGLESRLDDVAETLNGQEAFNGLFSEVRDISKKIKDITQALSKLEGAVGTTVETPLDRNSPVESQLDNILGLLQATSIQVQEMPKVTDVQTMHNDTQMSLQETKNALKAAILEYSGQIESRIAENTEEGRDLMTSLRSELNANSERVNQELHDLGKGQSVMVEMADHVLDTKKRLEHASRILHEVMELVMDQGFNINNTLNSRFDGISNDIMDNQNGALANLTVKMEQEINQVWRQINAMYQQMMESSKALNKLHKQNEAYVNGTTSTMDGMESKVGEITKRMSEVDTNLNYLLGRLSLVTQEFNQIKQGLGAALDNIKASFKEVQEKANEFSGKSSPGPHPVPQGYNEYEEAAETNQPAANRRR